MPKKSKLPTHQNNRCVNLKLLGRLPDVRCTRRKEEQFHFLRRVGTKSSVRICFSRKEVLTLVTQGLLKEAK